METYQHVTAPLARRLLIHGERPTHRLLTRAYIEAENALSADEQNAEIPFAVTDYRAAQLLELGPGRSIDERLRALRGFWGGPPVPPRTATKPKRLTAANDNRRAA